MVSMNSYAVYVRRDDQDAFEPFCTSFFENDARAADWAIGFHNTCKGVAVWRGTTRILVLDGAGPRRRARRIALCGRAV